VIAPIPADARLPGSSSPHRTRVALVEDEAYFRQAVVSAIGSAPDMELTGIAATLDDALALLKHPVPDVLLVDLGLPDGSGIDMIHAAHHAWPACNIMVCTTMGDEMHVMRSIEAGASGYLLKDSTPGNMLDEIRNLQAGGSPISPLIARQILTRFRKTSPSAAPLDEIDPAEAEAHLSEREQEVLHLVTRGFTAKEIAGLIKVSHNTVLTYVRRIYTKLNVCSKAEAIFEAQHRGLLAP
jgi:DNA-binding NarL/FixJ family response regulator